MGGMDCAFVDGRWCAIDRANDTAPIVVQYSAGWLWWTPDDFGKTITRAQAMAEVERRVTLPEVVGAR